jgi:transmembrane protein
MTPSIIYNILNSRITEIAARVLLTFPFWGSGLSKLINFNTEAVPEMEKYGLQPAVAIAVLTIIVQLGGSLLVILKKATWLGAGALGVFTFLTIVLVHTFWKLEGEHALFAFYTATEHVGMIGGLIGIAILSIRPRQP